MSIIKKMKLSDKQVVEIVKEWYTMGMYGDILQDAQGRDLEEICENKLYNGEPLNESKCTT